MMFFIAGAVFFEKGERTVFALLTTPLRFRHYLTAKLLTMSALALVTCVEVVLVACCSAPSSHCSCSTDGTRTP